MKKSKILVLITMFVFLLGIVGVQSASAAGVGAQTTKIATNLFGGATPAANAAITFVNAAGGAGNLTTVVYTTGVSLPVSLVIVKVQLAGAVFAVAAVNDGIIESAGVATSTLRSGGAIGDSYAEYNFNVTTVIPAGSTLTFTTPTLKGLAAMATPGATVTAAVEIRDTLGDIDAGNRTAAVILTSAVPYTGAFAATIPASPAVAPASGTIDVAQYSKFFTNNGTTGSILVNLGSLTFTDVAGAKSEDGTTDVAIAGGNAVSIAVNGNFSAADSTLANKGVFLSVLASCGTTLLAGTLNTALTAATFTNTAALTGLNVSGVPVYVCMQVTGVDTIPAQSPTATATMTQVAAAGKVTSASAISATPGTLLALALNGSTRYLYNIPSPDNASSYATVLIINDSSVDGRIYATITDNNGTSYPAELVTISPLAAGKTVKLTGSQIATAVGAPNWTGTKARLTITSETPSLQVQGMITATSNGTTFSTNFSTVAPQ